MRKYNGNLESVEMYQDHFVYDSDKLKVTFDQNNYSIIEIISKVNKVQKLKLEAASEMIYLIENLYDNSVFKK